MPLLTPLLMPVLVWFGKISYSSFYLWHFAVFRLVTEHIDGVAGKAVALAVAVAVAAASYYFIERPFLRLKDRLSQAPP